MVFKRISTGCDECRRQHTKCDGGRPSCGRCLRRKISCPGYRDIGGFVFKTETSYASNFQSNALRQMTIIRIPDKIFNVVLKDSNHFITFFFSTYIFSGRQNESSCGLFDHASVFCRQASTDSLLVKAARLLGATTFVLSQRFDGQDFSWYHKIRHEAIKALQHNITCETRRLEDETLMAVLLLDFTEVIVRAHLNSHIPLSHQHGALTLLKLRGALNFKTKQATSLYHATRYASLRSPVRSEAMVSTLQELDLLAKFEKTQQPPALKLLDVLDRIVELQNAFEAAISRGQSLIHLQVQLPATQKLLDAWVISLPANWLPHTAVLQAPTQTTTLTLVEYYKSMDIAVVFNLWRCARLKMMRLRQVFHQATLLHLQCFADETELIFNGIRRAVPVFLGILHNPRYVEQHAPTGAWKERCLSPTEHGTQRFPGDNLGKWFLSDLLRRLEQTIGHTDEILPRLRVSQDMLLFLREQREILSDMSPRSTQLVRVFPECGPSG